MTLESKENYPRHTKIVQNSLGFMPEVKPLHKPRGDLVLCARQWLWNKGHLLIPLTSFFSKLLHGSMVENMAIFKKFRPTI